MNHILTAPLPSLLSAPPAAPHVAPRYSYTVGEPRSGFLRVASPWQRKHASDGPEQSIAGRCRRYLFECAVLEQLGLGTIKARWAVGPRSSAPESPTPWLMGDQGAAGMRVSNYIKAIFTSIPMEVGVVAPGIVCCGFWRVTVEICSDSM